MKQRCRSAALRCSRLKILKLSKNGEIFVFLWNIQASDLAPLDPRNFWLIFQQKRFEKSDLDHKVGLRDFTLQKSRKLRLSLSLLLLALDLTLLLYRWQCQHFFWWKILRRAGPLSCRRTVNFSTIGRAISLMMMSKSWLENSQHYKKKFKDASLGRPFGPPSRRFR